MRGKCYVVESGMGKHQKLCSQRSHIANIPTLVSTAPFQGVDKGVSACDMSRSSPGVWGDVVLDIPLS